jgi:hypothetical protein
MREIAITTTTDTTIEDIVVDDAFFGRSLTDGLTSFR